ncbi:MAG TPA: hypothetical protein V6D50_18490 [Chroococcales cyanobacterium]|jgi:hypothetical protein
MHSITPRKLELLVKDAGENKNKIRNLSSVLNQFWQHLVKSIVQGQEPRIWQHTDRTGKIWWHGYDPHTERSICVDSEAEMRIWLEERYSSKDSTSKMPKLMRNLSL